MTELEKRLAEICNGLADKKATIKSYGNAIETKTDTAYSHGRICEITAIRDEIIEAVGLAHCVDCGFVIDD